MSEDEATYKTAEAEVVNEEQEQGTEVAKIDRGSLMTFNFLDLATMPAQKGIEVLNRFDQLTKMAWRFSVKKTFPRDWTLFVSESGIYGYLQDSGCERLMMMWGIDIFNVSDFNVENLPDGSTLYSLTGDGFSKATGQRVERALGARDTGSMLMGRSDEKVNKAKLKIDTMKAARSNLDGAIVRHLAQMGSVPVEMLTSIHEVPAGDYSKYNKGAGFGTQAERHGGVAGGKPNYGPPPKCPSCGTVMRLFDKSADGRVWWGCPKYKTCGQKTIPAKIVAEKAPEVPPEGPPEVPPDDDFGAGPPEILPANGEAQKIGSIKNRLTEELKSLPDSEELRKIKKQIFAAKTVNELFDLETVVSDAKRTSKKGGKS